MWLSWPDNLTYNNYCLLSAVILSWSFQGANHLHEARRNQFLHTSFGELAATGGLVRQIHENLMSSSRFITEIIVALMNTSLHIKNLLAINKGPLPFSESFLY